MKIPLLLILFWCCISGCNNSNADSKQPEDSLTYYPPTPASIPKEEFREYVRQLNQFFDSTLIGKGFNGSILIAKNGNILFEKYEGKVDLRGSDLITDTTAFHIASTSKPFTAMAILGLVQEGKFSLDDTLHKFFPDFPYPNITVKMLLNHRSGLPNYVYFIEHSKWDKTKYATNEDMLNILYSDKPNKSFSPDKRFSYSNTNYVLLAMIVEKVTTKSYPQYMQEKYFGPLNMDHTYVFTIKDTLTSTPSFSHNNAYWDFDFLDATYGDKNIYSTPRDLLKWDQALYTNQLFSKEMLELAFSAYSNERPSVHNYGLGWRLQFLPNNKKVIYHFGKWHGFNASFARLTDEGATIIILGNRFNRSIYRAAQLCYDIFGDYHQGLNKADGESESAETPVSKKQLQQNNPGRLKKTGKE